MHAANFDDRSRLEHRRADQEEVPDGSQSIKIRSTINFTRIHDRFRRHVERRASERMNVAARLVDTVELAHEPEVEQLGNVGTPDLTAEHDVGRFDVAVNQPDGVCLGQRTRNLQKDVACARGRQWAIHLDELL